MEPFLVCTPNSVLSLLWVLMGKQLSFTWFRVEPSESCISHRWFVASAQHTSSRRCWNTELLPPDHSFSVGAHQRIPSLEISYDHTVRISKRTLVYYGLHEAAKFSFVIQNISGAHRASSRMWATCYTSLNVSLLFHRKWERFNFRTGWKVNTFFSRSAV